MGTLVRAQTAAVRPTQNYLSQNTINRYLKLVKGRQNTPPVPVIENLWNDGVYDALDGHHNLAVSHHRTGTVDLWVVYSPTDFIDKKDFPHIDSAVITACNEQIRRRFCVAPFYVAETSDGNEIKDIKSLISYSKIVFGS